MKPELELRSVVRLITAVISTVGLFWPAWTEPGCYKKPGPRCVYSECPPTCSKACHIDYHDGWDECVDGLTYDECAELLLSNFPVYYWLGQCIDNKCHYGTRTIVYITTAFVSTDTSPCGGS